MMEKIRSGEEERGGEEGMVDTDTERSKDL